MPWWLVGGGIKTTENKNGPVDRYLFLASFAGKGLEPCRLTPPPPRAHTNKQVQADPFPNENDDKSLPCFHLFTRNSE